MGGNRFDYSKVEYKTRLEKVCIICTEHGEFWQTPAQHLHGALGCKACWSKKYSNSTEDFIKRATEIHGNKYNYSKTVYKTSRQKVTITCPKHGEFEQLPSNHLQGKGCPHCKSKEQAVLFNRLVKDFPNEEILYEVGNRVIPWLKGQRFDIYFPKYNIAVEYNGPQHYIPIQNLGGELSHLKTVERDKEKRKKM